MEKLVPFAPCPRPAGRCVARPARPVLPAAAPPGAGRGMAAGGGQEPGGPVPTRPLAGSAPRLQPPAFPGGWFWRFPVKGKKLKIRELSCTARLPTPAPRRSLATRVGRLLSPAATADPQNTQCRHRARPWSKVRGRRCPRSDPACGGCGEEAPGAVGLTGHAGFAARVRGGGWKGALGARLPQAQPRRAPRPCTFLQKLVLVWRDAVLVGKKSNKSDVFLAAGVRAPKMLNNSRGKEESPC